MKILKHVSYLYYLIGIVALAALLRFTFLTSVPPSLYWDEVSQGFNAYTILESGRDEHGEFFPLARFKAFGDYKAPVYTYAIVPFMQLFGKTDLSIRLPSAFFGTLTVLVTYFLAIRLFSSYSYKKSIALFSAFILSISPWHIQLSRGAYEGNIATFFTVLSTWLFLRGKDGKKYAFLLSVISFILAFYSFNAHRVFIPLFVIFITLIYSKDLIKMKFTVIASLIVGFLLMIPFLLYFMTPESKLRFNEVNIFSDLDVIEKSNQWIAYSDNSVISKVLDNRRVLYTVSYLKHYFDFFNPQYLFFTGDENPRFSLQTNGILYLWELPFLLLGFYLLLTHRNKESLVILGWFFLAPVVGATARETPHALRSETFIPTYQMITAFGISYVGVVLSQSRLKRLTRYGFFGVVCLACISVYVFLHNYVTHFPITYSGVWQYGYPQAVKKAQDLSLDYEKIVFTESFGRPYIYVAFYGNYTPDQYWKESSVTRDPFGFYNVSKLGKFEFRNIQGDEEISDDTLYVGSPSEIDSRFRVIETIYTLDGKPSFLIGEKES